MEMDQKYHKSKEGFRLKNSYWIWYPGDFELYHAMKQNFSRVERGMGWPAFWKSEGFRNRVVFRRTYQLQEETAFTVYSEAAGYVLAGDKKYPFGRKITCNPGEILVSVHAACIEKFPAIYIEGDVICSDGEWLVEDYDKPPVQAGYSRYFMNADQIPSVWNYDEKRYEPVSVEETDGGVLYGFETELTAQIEVRRINGADNTKKIEVFCGESHEEAVDLEHCYYSWEVDPVTNRTPRCAVRFVFLPQCKKEEISVSAFHQYVDIPVKASFSCDDELLNQIWAVAEHTFLLCSGIFFIDGIKRDKWIWGGDAYQSLFVNQYLMADPDINRRTLLALRGNDPMTTHINTIVDYSLYWILSVREHYEAYADEKFVRQVYPKMVSLMKFCGEQLDEHGFLIGREKDWIYIDWADLDKEGPLCAEQMLLAACYKAMAAVAAVVEDSACAASAEYNDKYMKLVKKIDQFYWDNDQSAYMDSFCSGKRHVTRHANIFAILYGIADADRQTQIVDSVLLNDNIPAITTPYFKFYELDVLCRMGKYAEVLEQIKAYWGGMLARGAVTFWEEYDPNVPEEEQYDMYGDKFGKSLCHAWAASPIYLLAKYFAGVRITAPGGEQYEVKPQMAFFRKIDCIVPVGMCRRVHIYGDAQHVNIEEIV